MSSDRTYGLGCALVLLSVVCILFALEHATSGRKYWVHPQVRGIVTDTDTGLPVADAAIELVDSEYGGGKTNSGSNGLYVLPPVSQPYRIAFYGDARFRTKVKCIARGYQPVIVEFSHGPSGVWAEHGTVDFDFKLHPLKNN